MMGADVLVKNAWYVAGLSHEFPPQRLQGQVIAEKPLVMWRTTAGGGAARRPTGGVRGVDPRLRTVGRLLLPSATRS